MPFVRNPDFFIITLGGGTFVQLRFPKTTHFSEPNSVSAPLTHWGMRSMASAAKTVSLMQGQAQIYIPRSSFRDKHLFFRAIKVSVRKFVSEYDRSSVAHVDSP